MSDTTWALGLDIDGAGGHPAAWRIDPGAAEPSPGNLRRAVSAAENADLAFVTLSDALTPDPQGPAVRLDAVVRASFVAPVTSRLGLVPQVHPAAVEPFHLASQLAALDHASLGRAGWSVGDGSAAAAGLALGRPVPGVDEIAAEAADVIAVVRALWDSWEDDAVIRDTATGRYIDRDRLHYVDFASGGAAGGESGRAPFTVKGPAIVPRSPQGQPVVFGRAGAVDSDLVDVVVFPFDPTAPQVPPATRSRRLAELTFTLDTGRRTAADRLAELDEANGGQGAAGFIGSAEDLVSLLHELRGEVDGVLLRPSVLWTDLPVLVREVLPGFRVDRSVPTPRPGSTLRDTLGLSRAANRFATVGGDR